MARSFYVNGEASILTLNNGSLTPLGISVDGVTVTVTQFQDGIATDTFGPHVFTPYMYMGNDAIIRAELVYFDPQIINKYLTGLPGLLTTPGVFGSIGTLFPNVNSGLDYSNRLVVQCTPQSGGITANAQCYNFPNAFLIDSAEIKIGTMRSTWTLTWRAVANYQASSSNGVVLFNSLCT
jgi:hypothetical protein